MIHGANLHAGAVVALLCRDKSDSVPSNTVHAIQWLDSRPGRCLSNTAHTTPRWYFLACADASTSASTSCGHGGVASSALPQHGAQAGSLDSPQGGKSCSVRSNICLDSQQACSLSFWDARISATACR